MSSTLDKIKKKLRKHGRLMDQIDALLKSAQKELNYLELEKEAYGKQVDRHEAIDSSLEKAQEENGNLKLQISCLETELATCEAQKQAAIAALKKRKPLVMLPKDVERAIMDSFKRRNPSWDRGTLTLKEFREEDVRVHAKVLSEPPNEKPIEDHIVLDKEPEIIVDTEVSKMISNERVLRRIKEISREQHPSWSIWDLGISSCWTVRGKTYFQVSSINLKTHEKESDTFSISKKDLESMDVF